MTTKKTWSLSWNEKERQFIARYRRVDRPGWGSQRIPKAIASGRHQQLDAERWLIDWYENYIRTGGLPAESARIKPVAKTLKLLAPRWLQYRHDDRGTAINTHREARKVVNAWILDNERFPHFSIQDLDMERDFTAEVCLRWMRSLRGNGSTPLRYSQLLRTLFEDCIAHEWLSPEMSNPFRRPIVAKEFRRLQEASTEHRVITFLDNESACKLLVTPSSKVLDYRRMRYLVALSTGLRDKELQGLIWSDIQLDAAIPHIRVERQLFKPGVKPFVQYEELRDRGMSKTEIVKVENALTTLPKRKSRRAIPLLPLAIAALRHWKNVGWHQWVGFAAKGDDAVFPGGRQAGHEPSNRFSVVASPGLLRMDLDRLGLPTTFEGKPLVFHTLRHTFATQLEAGGVERSMIGDLLGHKAKGVARAHYIAPLLEARSAALQKLVLPDTLRLKGVVVHADGRTTNDGKVIVLRDRAPRAWLLKRQQAAKRRAPSRNKRAP